MGTLVQILLPVFGLILLGVLLQKSRFLDAGMETAFNKFCYYVALPVFIVMKAARSPSLNAEAIKTAGALLLVTLGLMLAGWLTAKLIRLPKRSVGTFIQSAFRGNLAYIGLPVIAFALAGQSESVRQQAETLAILTMAPAVLTYNLLGVMVLEWDRRHESHRHPLKSWGQSTLKNPLILACVVGFTWNALALPFPDLGVKFASPIAATAFPLALLAIGARIAVLSWRKGLFYGLMLCMVKNGMGLVFGVIVCHVLDLQGIHQLVILVLSVCPTAVASYVLVDQLDGDRDLSAATIALSTLGSLFALIAALYIGMAS